MIGSLVVLFFALVMCVLIGVGIAIGLVACGLAAMLIGLGVVSSSFVVGLWKGRAAAGVRMFLLQCGLLVGVPAGAVCALLLQWMMAATETVWPTLVGGALGGAVAGLVVALTMDFLFWRLQGWASKRLAGPAALAIDKVKQVTGFESGTAR